MAVNTKSDSAMNPVSASRHRQMRAPAAARLGKRGVMFTIDALLASFVLISGLLLISQYLVKENPRESIEYVRTDALLTLSNLKVGEIDQTFVTTFLVSSHTNNNLSVLEQIGTYWAANETVLANALSDHVLSGILPENIGFSLVVGNDSVFEQNLTGSGDVAAGEQMITGIMQGAPITGSTSSAFLRKISDKRTSSFAYFGGFVGQGNITVVLEDIPSDVNSSDINQIILEVDAVAPFNLVINDAFCAAFNPLNTSMSPDSWDVTNCSASLAPGENNVTLDFMGNINEAYVSGGYLKVSYKTDELQQLPSTTERTYSFPEIRGVANLYDGFFVPGELTSMQIYLHYLADHSVDALNNTFYINIGNTTVFVDTDSVTEQSVTLDNALLSAILNYSALGGKTVPIRIGFENLTYASELVGNSEVMLVTDVSGSMDWKMIGPDYDNGNLVNCGDPAINDSDTSRLSVAKCLDKSFAYDVLNITGNYLGVVSYSTSTDAGDTISPSTNLTRIYNVIGNSSPETGYAASGTTCICCGINSARDELARGARRTVLVAANSTWRYTTNGFLGAPDNDTSGDAWYEFDFDDASWSSGTAVLGHNASGGSGAGIRTELGSGSTSAEVLYADLWEYSTDTAGPPNDFSSGVINSTANTFNLSGANDGWDWKGGVFGYDNDTDFNGASGGHLNMDFRTGGTNRNNCANNDCSGAYGISVNVTPQMAAIISSSGSAMLSFNYEWDGADDPFSASDEVWIKAKWVRSNGTEQWLGSQLDSTHTSGDTDPEIFAADNPNQEFSGSALIDLSDYISGSGMYYLYLGSKLRANQVSEWGYAYFDNIQLRFTNRTDKYYFRKHFNITDLSLVARGFINLLSDDTSKVYVNGNLVYSPTEDLNGTYWDARGIYLEGSLFKLGDNVVAVELTNSVASARFDLELVGVNKTSQGAMLVMTDGEANEDCAEQGTGDAIADAIKAACDAREDWGIQVFSVGFSASAEETTLQGMASCGEGIYAKSDNVSALANFYNQVVLNIIAASVKSQTVILSGGNLSASNLYRDSYIYYTFNPVSTPPEPNEISVEMQTDKFNNCSATITIPAGITVADAKVTSYSGPHWTRILTVNNVTVYNLSEYNSNYITLGDPYTVNVPSSLLVNGANSIYIDTGDSPVNGTGCSLNNTLIYTALVPSATSRSQVVERTEGCEWVIQFEDNTNSTKKIPYTYAGAKKCSYTEANHTLATNAYDPNDAYDIAVYNLLQALDFDNNGKAFVNLDSEDIEIVITTVSSVPYLWGPTVVRAEVWQ